MATSGPHPSSSSSSSSSALGPKQPPSSLAPSSVFFSSSNSLDTLASTSVSAAPSPPSDLLPATPSSLTSIEILKQLGVSLPPTADELETFRDVPLSMLPKRYRRETEHRIFVNRNLSMEKIKAVGLDLDYTTVIYKAPEYEKLAFKLTIERLISIGYPESFRAFAYDPSFPIRGLFFDTLLGNLLKLDSYQNIVVCAHGHKTLSSVEIKKYYPSKFVHSDDIGKRFQVLNTLFQLPEICLYADVIDYFDTHPDYAIVPEKTGVTGLNVFISYKSLFQDVRTSVDWIHNQGTLKAETLADLPRYAHRDPRLPVLLHRLRESGRKVILITNSGYYYTNGILNYLFDLPNIPHPKWQDYFDIVITDAQKPDFFAEGTMLREVDLQTSAYKIGSVLGGFLPGHVYAGGSSEILSKHTGLSGEEILYAGDHIFGDILKSKKEHGWRTFLVVPELDDEVSHWMEASKVYEHLQNLEFILAETFRGLSSDCVEKPDISALKDHIFHTMKELNVIYNQTFGSLFRSGSSQTFFAMQTRRYGDLYGTSFVNLVHYPLFYNFLAPDDPMPHESTTHHAGRV